MKCFSETYLLFILECKKFFFFVNYLEENGFSVFALWTGVILGPGEGRISNDVSHDLGQLVDFVHDLVDVDAAAVSQLKETAKS